MAKQLNCYYSIRGKLKVSLGTGWKNQEANCFLTGHGQFQHYLYHMKKVFSGTSLLCTDKVKDGAQAKRKVLEDIRTTSYNAEVKRPMIEIAKRLNAQYMQYVEC